MTYLDYIDNMRAVAEHAAKASDHPNGDEVLRWYVAYNIARSFFDYSTKDFANTVLSGMDPLTENAIELTRIALTDFCVDLPFDEWYEENTCDDQFVFEDVMQERIDDFKQFCNIN